MGRTKEKWPIYKRESKGKGSRFLATVNVGVIKPYSKTFATKDEAKKWLRQEWAKNSLSLNQKHLAYRNKDVSWLCAYWFENYSKKRKAFSSCARDLSIIKNHILPKFGKVKFQLLDAEHIENWLGELGGKDGKLSPKSCNHILGLLIKIYNDAVRWKMILSNPLVGIERFKVPKKGYSIWTIEEKEAFLSYVRINYPRIYPVFETALKTGLRAGELRALQWRHINFETERIVVEKSFCQRQRQLRDTTKSAKVREVPMTKSLVNLLRLKKNENDSEFVFTNFDFTHPARSLKKLAAEAGVRKIRFHDLRHTFASHYLQLGGDIVKLKQILGHHSVTMTENYIHHSPKHLAGTTEILERSPLPTAQVISINR